MEDGETEDSSYIAALQKRFAARMKGADDAVEQRIKEERRADQTEGEKSRRRGPPKLQFNVRATQETRDLIDALAAHYQTDGKPMSLSDVVALAFDTLAKATPGFEGGKQ